MNLPNKLTISRIVLAFIILIMLCIPWHALGFSWPVYLYHGVTFNLKYIIAGILFLIASLTDKLDGHIARKYNMVTDFGKMIDAISDKLLTNSLLIILACDNMIHPVIPVIIIVRDIVVDSIKMLIGNKGKAVAAIPVAKWKTATLMVGLTLTLFYNLPFELFGIRVSSYLLIIASVLAIYSGAKYYVMAREYITDK